MKRLIVAVGLTVVGFAGPVAAAEEIQKIDYGVVKMETSSQPGLLPGTVLLRRAVLSFNEGRKGNAGDVLGECWTLVNESVVKRDLGKQPISKDEILGFSCTRMKVVAP